MVARFLNRKVKALQNSSQSSYLERKKWSSQMMKSLSPFLSLRPAFGTTWNMQSMVKSAKVLVLRTHWLQHHKGTRMLIKLCLVSSCSRGTLRRRSLCLRSRLQSTRQTPMTNTSSTSSELLKSSQSKLLLEHVQRQVKGSYHHTILLKRVYWTTLKLFLIKNAMSWQNWYIWSCQNKSNQSGSTFSGSLKSSSSWLMMVTETTAIKWSSICWILRARDSLI